MRDNIFLVSLYIGLLQSYAYIIYFGCGIGYGFVLFFQIFFQIFFCIMFALDVAEMEICVCFIFLWKYF